MRQLRVQKRRGGALLVRAHWQSLRTDHGPSAPSWRTERVRCVAARAPYDRCDDRTRGHTAQRRMRNVSNAGTPRHAPQNSRWAPCPHRHRGRRRVVQPSKLTSDPRNAAANTNASPRARTNTPIPAHGLGYGSNMNQLELALLTAILAPPMQAEVTAAAFLAAALPFPMRAEVPSTTVFAAKLPSAMRAEVTATAVSAMAFLLSMRAEVIAATLFAPALFPPVRTHAGMWNGASAILALAPQPPVRAFATSIDLRAHPRHRSVDTFLAEGLPLRRKRDQPGGRHPDDPASLVEAIVNAPLQPVPNGLARLGFFAGIFRVVTIACVRSGSLRITLVFD